MSDPTTIAARRQQHVDAINRADIVAMAETTTDDVVIMPPNLPVVVGKPAARALWKTVLDAGVSGMEVKPAELELAGDWAFDRFAWSMANTPAGGEADHGNCVWIWRKQVDGDWLLSRAIWNSDKPAAG